MSFIVWVWLLGITMAVVVLLMAARWRRVAELGSELATGLLLASFPLIFAAQLSLLSTIAAAVLHVWLLVLPVRLYMGRLEPPFLLGSTRLNAVIGWLLVVTVTIVEVFYVGPWLELVVVGWLIASICIGLVFLGQLVWNLRHFKMRENELPLKDLPTVSVCIPARNEDHALADCLESVLASDYPKLEVLVLDDCSQDKTSTIIRSFAHEGVRFVQGDQPALGWLGKNQAMQTLVSHASGDYILFLGVDTHVTPQSISKLLNYTLASDYQMVSVAPQSRLALASSNLLGTLEHFWRIVLPLTKKRMPVSSKMWLIKRSSLDRLGGFESVSRKIVPEESFARRLFTANAYRFLVSNASLGVTTAKRWSSQIETSLRLAYPLVRRQPFYALGACLFLIAAFLAPIAIALFEAMAGRMGIVFWLSVSAGALYFIDYFLVVVRIQPKAWLLSSLLLPLVVVQETIICAVSMALYEFAEVNWKGRNVCYPVLSPQPPRPGYLAWRRQR
jgi:glycosyltransferase involved in cell wall biosynthesis